VANDDPAEQLKKLSDLRAQGVLSEAEFTAAKAKVIGGTQPLTAGVTASGVTCALGFAAVIIGSIGPWATSPLSSASGFTGDGKITAIAAVIGIFLIFRKAPRTATLMALVALGIGIYDAIHINERLRNVTLLGAQIDHVGWGVYVVIGGAVIAAVAALKSRTGDDKPAVEATPVVGA
jgi:hypothetical protein